MKEFYNKNGIVVRRSVKQDMDYLKDNLREEDIKEIWASNHFKPEQALKESMEKSILCCTVLNGTPLAVFGISPVTVLDDKAIVWMLSSHNLNFISKRFVRNSKFFIQKMLEFYPYLFNFVHAENKTSIRWLKYCGAVVEDAKPYGAENELFHYFFFKKS